MQRKGQHNERTHLDFLCPFPLDLEELGSCACYCVIQSTIKSRPNVLSVQTVAVKAQGRELQKACLVGEVQAKWLGSSFLIRNSSPIVLCVSLLPCLWDVNSTRACPLPWLLCGASFPHIVVTAGSSPSEMCVGCVREYYSIAVQVSLRVLTVQLGNSLLSTSEEATLTDTLGPDGQQCRQAPQG
jgi:hypothetical protein